jgi:hypothetical protein
MGLLIDLGYPYNTAKSVIFLLIVGLGIGGLFQTPLIGLQAAMPTRDMAVATGALVLFRLLGSAAGVAIGGSILNNQLSSRLSALTSGQGIGLNYQLQNVSQLVDLPEPLRSQILSAFASYPPSLPLLFSASNGSRSIGMIWIVMTPLAGVGLICVLFARKYTLHRNFVKEADQKPGGSGAKDVEEAKEGDHLEVLPEPEKLPESQAPPEEEKVDKDITV